ncbi:hypothetical protein [Sphaerisporangium sp. TRM90804]|uniref:AMIN-like domain-containing (lipo)protein n=1 Tax=Sphaerisporangium sp. TRM90804 TaxID=3031113 RepID=UPI0024471D1D|nr:hypothetical protein [Sphaerisporangium sp. TRM90804]MDH2423928.1 hypothetical protein [Sphaerisporangium sp. TRM90804]
MKKIAVTAVLVSFTLLTACGSAENPAPQATATVTVSPSEPASSAPETSTPATGPSATASAGLSGTPAPSAAASTLPPPTGTKQVEVTRNPSRPPLVVGARAGGHKGFDRVVIDLKGPMTGYTVGWVKRILEDGSGDPIEAEGDAYLQVTLRPANAHTPDGKPTWGRTPVLRPELSNVRSIIRAGDFEAVVTVAVALRHRAGFRVLEQREPSRLVVDIAH